MTSPAVSDVADGDLIELDGDVLEPLEDDAPDEGDEKTEKRESSPSFSREPRARFERLLHPMPRERRRARALEAEEPDLSAFCHDPDPGVIRAVTKNLHAGLTHARLIAAHHRHAGGLASLLTRPEWLKDSRVTTLLVRNPRTPDVMLRRILARERLLSLVRFAQDRDAPERNRVWIRRYLQERFRKARPDERVASIMAGEGRILGLIDGVPFDERTSRLLANRRIGSQVLIRNLARYPGTSTIVLEALLRLPLVKRQGMLQAMIRRHPNAPPRGRAGPGAPR